MTFGETPEQRTARRAAVRALVRFGVRLHPPAEPGRDAGQAQLQQLVDRVGPTLDCAEEQEELRRAVAGWNEACKGEARLVCPDMTIGTTESGTAAAAAAAAAPSAPPPLSPAPPQPDDVPAGFRIHAADIQLTFNCKSWVPAGQTVAEWWPISGTSLASSFLKWATVELPLRFREGIAHCSLTMEESLAAGRPQVHLHAQITFKTRIDRTSTKDFAFLGIRPHVETNRARGANVDASRARAHFYVYANKVGTLYRYTDWWPFIDYEVNAYWLTSLSEA